MTGTIDGVRAVEIMNVAATAFFDAHVRATGVRMAELEGFPELSTQTNLPTQRIASR
jgi:hypothetical protein